MSSKYIVRLKSSSTEDDLKTTIKAFEDYGGKVTHNHTLFKGFTGELPENQLMAFEETPHVEAIERDQKVSIQ